MNLPEGFIFSQGSLQDFVDCRRRFQLRYLRRLAWPALETEPALEAERYLQQGALFHRILQQYWLGVPVERLSPAVAGEDLGRWWGNFLTYHKDLTGFQSLPGHYYPEISLSAALGAYRLEAKYDLVVIRPEHSEHSEHSEAGAVIYDWKTSRHRSERRWLAKRLQTRLYPYLLARAGNPLNAGQALAPERIEMVYWFADHPDQPERFAYSPQAFQEDETYLKELIETILRLGEDEFPLTSDLQRCAFCVYRSLCERGARAGDLDDAEADLGEEPALGLDFEQIAEIEF
jgi:CRISPR/Cas system-associated exonuclease Cas4 (RecB family)